MKRMLSRLLAISLIIFSGPLMAQNYPRRTITMIIPFAAGGPTDALGRIIANSMSATLGKQVVVENITGAGGMLARLKTAQAEPDGYTTMLAGLGTATSATLYRKLPYDPVGAFDAVGLITKVPMVVVGRKDLPPKDIGELIRYIKANTEKVTFGDGGLGSGSQFCGLLLMSALQVQNDDDFIPRFRTRDARFVGRADRPALRSDDDDNRAYAQWCDQRLRRHHEKPRTFSTGVAAAR